MPTTSTPSREARPATAPSIASRWSPWEWMTPPRSVPVPVTAKPSSVASISAPSPRRPSTTVAIRSDSLIRSSCAPSHDGLAVGEDTRAAPRAAARRSPAAPPAPSTTVPVSGAWATSSSHTGSAPVSGPPAGSRGPTTTPPIRSQDAEEADARPVGRHPVAPRSASPARAPRPPRGRPPRTGRPARGSAPARARRPARPSRASPSRVTATPLRSSSRSVWSRLGTGSTTVVAPVASRPASSTHDLTCAEATGSSVLDPGQLGGGQREGREAALAGVDARAHAPAAARRCGRPAGGGSRRRRRASTPRRRAGRPASRAAGASACRRCRRRARRRAPPRRAVPGRGSAGARRGPRPASRPPARPPASTACPRPGGSWSRVTGSALIAASSAARCEHDLSGGAVTVPRRRRPAGAKKRELTRAPRRARAPRPAARPRPPDPRPRSTARSSRSSGRPSGRAPCRRC